jgi:uncharacterized membrane protein (UPF0136 family)
VADAKITALTATTTVTDDDLFVLVDDPGGTPTNKKITAANLRLAVGSGADGTGHTNTDRGSSVPFATCTASATPHTVGSWQEVIASTSSAGDILVVTLMAGLNVNATDTSTLLDIGTGAGGAEVALISNIAIGHVLGGATYVFNVAIASGTRLSVRCRSVVASKTVSVGLSVRQSGSNKPAPSTVTTLNAATASSSATVLTAAGSTNTDAAWTEIISSTAATYTRMVVALAGPASSSATAATGLVDIGTGALGAEVAIVSDIGYSMGSTENIIPQGGMYYEVNIPSGTRLVARYQSTSTTTGARPNITIHLS